MKTSIQRVSPYRFGRRGLLPLVLALVGCHAKGSSVNYAAGTASQDREGPSTELIAVRGELVHTMAGEAIHNGVVVCRDGRILAVGGAEDIAIPEGARILEARVVTPGLVDARSVIGLAGWLNQDQDQDQLDPTEAVQPELRAVDAYNPKDPLVAWVRSFGVTTVHTGHGPGAVISGQTMIVKTRGNTVEEATLVPRAMVAATLGEGATRGKGPGTRAKAVAVLRQQLIRAREHLDALEGPEEKRPSRDLRLETLADVLRGELPLMITAHRVQDVMTALRLQREFGFELVLDGASESYRILEHLREAEAKVLIHAPMARAGGERENLSMETPHLLQEAGIDVATQSGYEGYVPKTRVVLFEAAIAAANGCGPVNALRLVTLDAAKILGIDDRVGSLEVGKHADLALYDGDPFEYASHCVGVLIEGEVVFEGSR